MPTALHDLFTLLCDSALERPPQPWRCQSPEPYRLRFLHHVAQAAGLLSPGAARVTPLALDWLRRPPASQLSILAEAWASQADRLVRQRCLEQVMDLSPGQNVSPEALTGRRSPRHARRLWQPLVWLGLLADEGPAGLRRETGPEIPAGYGPWRVGEARIEVEPPYEWVSLYSLEQIAVLEEIGPPRCYRLDGDHWRQAQERGYPAAAALHLLESQSDEAGLPPAVLTHFATPTAIMVQPGVLLTFSDREQLSQLRKARAGHRRLKLILSPHHAWLPAAEEETVVKWLRRRGLSLQREPLAPAITATDSRPNRFNYELLHLVLSARVMQTLAEELALPAPLDPVTLAQWTGWLPASQQRRLEQLVAAQVEGIRRRLAEPAAVIPGSLPPQSTAEVGETISKALAASQSLQLYYQPPPPRPLITRPVIPLRLESWGDHTYLIATCLHRRAPRTFRLDRIRHVAPLPESEQ